MADLNQVIQEEIKYWVAEKNGKSLSYFNVPSLDGYIGTTIGTIRNENQDKTVLVKIDGKTPLIAAVLCDGMGGMIEGSDCAELAVSIFISSFITEEINNEEETFEKAILKANDYIYQKYHGDGGSTFSAVVRIKNSIYGFNVGDSRIYALDNKNVLHQLTTDDTLEGQLAAIKKDYSANLFQEYKQLVQYIGMGPGVKVNKFNLTRNNDYSKIIITSDGAHEFENRLFEKLIINSKSNKEIVERLLFVSEWVGGKDNASVISLNFKSIFSELNSNLQNPTAKLYNCYQRTLIIPIIFEKFTNKNNIQIDKDVDKNIATDDSKKKTKKYSRKKRSNKEIVEGEQPKEKIKIDIKTDEDEPRQ